MPAERAPIGVVLAAGLGTRLRPLTDRWAKPVLPFMNRPILHYSLDALRDAGIHRIGVNTYHCPDQVARCVDSWCAANRGVETVLSAEEELLGTGGGARRIWEQMGCPDTAAVVLNGDIVGSFEMSRFIESHIRAQRFATLVVSLQGEGRVVIDSATLQVKRLPSWSCESVKVEDLPARAREVSFCGVSVLSREALEVLPERGGCLFRDGLTNFVGTGQIGAEVTQGWYDDLGTPSRYWEATRRRLLAHDPESEPDLPPHVVVHPPVVVAPDVRFDGACEIGPFVVLGGGARVTRQARLERAIVFGGEVVGEVAACFQVEGASLRLDER